MLEFPKKSVPSHHHMPSQTWDTGHCAVPHSSQLTITSPQSGQKFLSVTQSSSLHILKNKEDIIISKAAISHTYFTYQHLCYTGYNWAIINCFARTLERKHRLHEFFLALGIIQQLTASFSKKCPISQSKLLNFVKHMQWRDWTKSGKMFFWHLTSCFLRCKSGMMTCKSMAQSILPIQVYLFLSSSGW